jgi:hypothetical protein
MGAAKIDIRSIGPRMSAMGHERKSRHVRIMSVLPLKADIHLHGLYVRFVPRADIYSLGRTDGGGQRRADELRQSN